MDSSWSMVFVQVVQAREYLMEQIVFVLQDLSKLTVSALNSVKKINS